MRGSECAVAVAIALLLAPRCSAKVDTRRLGEIFDNHSVPAIDRIALGVRFLRDELADPTPDRKDATPWGSTTAGVLAGITGSIAFPGSEAPTELRSLRDNERDGRVKGFLTIALALTGAQDTLPWLLKVAIKEPDGPVRRVAYRALGKLAQEPRPTDNPKRLRSGETWRPLDANTYTAVTRALMEAIADPYMTYRGMAALSGSVLDLTRRTFPTQDDAALYLKFLGFRVERVIEGGMVTGWKVRDRKGELVYSVTLRISYRPAPTGGVYD